MTLSWVDDGDFAWRCLMLARARESFVLLFASCFSFLMVLVLAFSSCFLTLVWFGSSSLVSRISRIRSKRYPHYKCNFRICFPSSP